MRSTEGDLFVSFVMPVIHICFKGFYNVLSLLSHCFELPLLLFYKWRAGTCIFSLRQKQTCFPNGIHLSSEGLHSLKFSAELDLEILRESHRKSSVITSSALN